MSQSVMFTHADHDPQGIPRLHRRGIPGVRSDSYHFGFFEDSTSHHANPPVHTEYDAIVEPLYIFLGLLLIFVILTFFLFGMREYLWSLNKKKRLGSAGSAWSNHSILLTGMNAERNTNQFKEKNRAYPDLHNSRILHQHLINADPSPLSDATDNIQEPVYNHLNVVRDSPAQSNSPGLHEKLEEMDMGTFSMTSPPPGVTGYSIRELMSLKPSEIHSVPIALATSSTPQNLEESIMTTFHAEAIKFKSGKVIQKSITDIDKELRERDCNPALRQIAVMRLVGIAARATSMTNASIFLPQFTRLMDYLIDTGTIFDILNQSNAYTARHLIDMVIHYCYSHWLFGKDRDPRILEQFRRWKFHDPLAQPHHVIFRYLVNLQLGLYFVEEHLDAELLENTKARTTILLHHLVTTSTHGDPETIIPILEQACNIASVPDIRISYYDLLLRLIQLHIECCMSKMLQRKELSLKSLIQSGVLTKNHEDIVKRAKKVAKLVINKAPSLHIWMDEVNNGLVFVSQSPLPIHPTPSRGFQVGITDQEKHLRPGSWRSTQSSGRLTHHGSQYL